MIKIQDTKVISNIEIAPNIYDMYIKAETIAKEAKCGQFINVYLNKDQFILPRPISICEIGEDTLRIIYHIAGAGTEYLKSYQAGDPIKIAGPLGNGFEIEKKNNVVLMGGGIGLPPMYQLAKSIKALYPETVVDVFAGFRNQDLIILAEEFKSLGVHFHIATDDGSRGFKGNVLQCLKASGISTEIIYACGPNVMLNGICAYGQEQRIDCFVSMEERMACGFGACVGCAVKIKENNEQGWIYKKVCKDGPVFAGKDVIFNG